MNLRRIPIAMIIGFLSLACLAYAHSQSTSNEDSGTYESFSWFTGGCTLEVRHEGTSWRYISGSSRTQFFGFWPFNPGVVELGASVRHDEPPGVDAQDLLETLDVTFATVDGQLRPVSYKYNNTALEKQNHLIAEEQCGGLKHR